MIAYDAVLCATGGPARTFRAPESFTIPGADARNIFPLRDLAHAEGIERALAAKGSVQRSADGSERLVTPAGADVSVVVIGSSFIGMEAAGYLVQVFTDGGCCFRERFACTPCSSSLRRRRSGA